MLTHILNLFVSSILIESDTFSYETQSILGEGFFGIVYQAKAIRKSGEPRLRKSTAVDMPPIVALKCIKERGLPDPVDLVSQLVFMNQLQAGGAHWAPRGYEVFKSDNLTPCLSMELMGESIQKKRQSQSFSHSQIANIGLQMLDIYQDMHENFNLSHSDGHAGNWVYRLDDLGKISPVDFGWLKPITEFSDRVFDMKWMIITLRWLIDMDPQYFTPKHIPKTHTADDICPRGLVPDELRRIVQYVYTDIADPRNMYADIRAMLIQMIPSDEQHHVLAKTASQSLDMFSALPLSLLYLLLYL
jgi:serine/threonine protein kinase